MYQEIVHFESDGFRGIDVGIISRYPLSEVPVAHVVDFGGDGKGDTRDIVEATFDIDGEVLTVIANHWPSLAGKTSNEKRQITAQVLREIVDQRVGEGRQVLALGDFNTLDSEDDHPIRIHLAGGTVRPNLPMIDVQAFFEPDLEPKSSYFSTFSKDWVRLDRILASNDFADRSRAFYLDETSYEIPHFDEMLRDDNGRPWRFDFERATGYSDHLPVAVRVWVGALGATF
jgi:endonuclease/exonuclease/phosphatase family metal-dependent hydrolase